MEILYASENNFNELINNDTVLVDFFAEWCGPCKMLAPILEEINEDRSNIKIVKVNVDDIPSLAKSYGIMSIPTLLLFKNGNLVKQTTGFMQKEDLIEWIEN